MNITHLKTHQDVSTYVARQLTAQVQLNPACRIILASGGTPSDAYQIAAEQLLYTDTSRVTIIKLDEWVGLPEGNGSSCEYQLQREVILLWGIEPHHYLSLDGSATPIEDEAKRVRERLADMPSSSLCILGLGLNGHIGFLEPSHSLPHRTSVVELHPMSKKHPMVNNQYDVEFGITIGVGDIMECDKVILVVTGKHKQQILSKLLDSDITTLLPASLLKLHPNVEIVADDEALLLD